MAMMTMDDGMGSRPPTASDAMTRPCRIARPASSSGQWVAVTAAVTTPLPPLMNGSGGGGDDDDHDHGRAPQPTAESRLAALRKGRLYRVPPLQFLVRARLIHSLDALGDLGSIPQVLVDDVLIACSPERLQVIERETTAQVLDTEHHYERYCRRMGLERTTATTTTVTAAGHAPVELPLPTWRQTYLRAMRVRQAIQDHAIALPTRPARPALSTTIISVAEMIRRDDAARRARAATPRPTAPALFEQITQSVKRRRQGYS